MKVQVDVLKDDGTVKTAGLTYEAPEGTRLGDVGLVHLGSADWGGTYTARVTSLESSYDGYCKAFRPIAIPTAQR